MRVVEIMRSDQESFANVEFYKSKVLLEGGGADPVYTYNFSRGVSDCSHGLVVAKMAGLPNEIIQTAKQCIEKSG